MDPSIRMTEAEQDVMAVVWERQPVAASTVAQVLKEKRNWTLATVRTLLRRLVDKKALRQELDGKRYLYTACVSVEECARQESESFLDRVLGWAPSETIVHMVGRVNLSRADILELRRILREKEK